MNIITLFEMIGAFYISCRRPQQAFCRLLMTAMPAYSQPQDIALCQLEIASVCRPGLHGFDDLVSLRHNLDLCPNS